MSNQDEKIVCVGNWQCSYRVKFSFPAYDEIFVESLYENADVSEIKVILRKIAKKHK